MPLGSEHGSPEEGVDLSLLSPDLCEGLLRTRALEKLYASLPDTDDPASQESPSEDVLKVLALLRSNISELESRQGRSPEETALLEETRRELYRLLSIAGLADNSGLESGGSEMSKKYSLKLISTLLPAISDILTRINRGEIERARQELKSIVAVIQALLKKSSK